MTSMLELHTITDGEVEELRAALMTTFGDDADDVDPDGASRFRALIPPGRAWVVRDGGQVVATAASFAHELVIPGGTMAMAGLTMVTVRPTHRRRGLLRRLIDRHLADARDHGEAVSGLWASEAAIYGRFGYGVATFVDALEADLGGLEVAAGRELDAVTWLDEPGAREALPPIYARATADRPGAFVRSDAWWRERRFLEAPFSRAGASRRRHVATRRGDELTGYVAFRQRSTWDAAVAAGTVEVLELVAQDARAEATLWRFLAGIDLFPRVSWGLAPVDGLLPWLIADARRVRRRRALDRHRRPHRGSGRPRLAVPGRGHRHHPRPRRPRPRQRRRRRPRRPPVRLAGRRLVPGGVLTRGSPVGRHGSGRVKDSHALVDRSV